MSEPSDAFAAALDAVDDLQRRIEALNRLGLLQSGNARWLREQISDLFDSIDGSRAKLVEGKEWGR